MIPELFLKRMQERLGKEFPAFFSVYGAPPRKGLRVNTLKLSAEEFSARAPFPLGERIARTDGFYISEEKPGGDAYHFAGLYYLQEPSAMTVAEAARDLPKRRVLDLCAAPGGKTTQLAAMMGGEGVLVANEIIPARAKILSQNVERMGIPNCAVISASPEALAEKFPAAFDLILVDAPCSGEGMFRKEENAVAEWSEENVARCAARQRDILACADRMLARGGRLIYSTCTFAEEEDEWQIDWFLGTHSAFSREEEKKLLPHRFQGEGHFMARLIKEEGDAFDPKPFRLRTVPAAERAYAAFQNDFFDAPPQGDITTLPDGRMYLVPAGMPDFSGLHLLRLGVELGEFDGKRFKPAHALAMAYGKNAKRKLSLSREGANAYLRGETLETDLPEGWCVVCVEEFPLGLGKCAHGIVKNHLPKALRKIT